MPLEYVVTVIVGVGSLGSTVFEYSANAGSLAGTPTMTQDISNFPIGTFVVIVAAVIVAVRYWRIRRKSKKAAPKAQTK